MLEPAIASAQAYAQKFVEGLAIVPEADHELVQACVVEEHGAVEIASIGFGVTGTAVVELEEHAFAYVDEPVSAVERLERQVPA